MISSSNSSGNHQEPLSHEPGDKPGFYENMRTADKRLTELLANGYAFSKGGDDLLPIGEPQFVFTPFTEEHR